MTESMIASTGDSFPLAPPQDAHPHACMGSGLVFLTYGAEVEGEEVEIVGAVPCRRCAEAREDAS